MAIWGSCKMIDISLNLGHLKLQDKDKKKNLFKNGLQQVGAES